MAVAEELEAGARPPDVGDGPEIFHMTCCDNEDLTACGVDVAGMPFTDGVGEQRCVVCFGLAKDWCPTRQGRCPRFGWRGRRT